MQVVPLPVAASGQIEIAKSRAGVRGEVPNGGVEKVSDVDYEVKFYLEAERLVGPGDRLSRELTAGLGIGQPPKRLRMQFLDDDLSLHRSGWNIRFREIDGRSGLELTYKRRYRLRECPVDQPEGCDEVSREDERKALGSAADEGLELDREDVQAEVEWGYAKQIMTVSRRTRLPPEGAFALDLPALARSKELAGLGAPAALGTGLLAPAAGLLGRSRISGPVDGLRWEGRLESKDVVAELWWINVDGPTRPPRPVLELSLRDGSRDDAAEVRRRIRSYLSDRAWLRTEDLLKTEMILANHR